MKRHVSADFGKRQTKTGQKMSFRAKWVEIMRWVGIIEGAVKHENK